MKQIFLVVAIMLSCSVLGAANDLSGKWKIVDIGLNDTSALLLVAFADKGEIYVEFTESKCLMSDNNNNIIEEQNYKRDGEALLFLSNGIETPSQIVQLNKETFKIVFENDNWYQLAKVK